MFGLILALLAVPAQGGTLRVRLDSNLELLGAAELSASGAKPAGFVRRGNSYVDRVERLSHGRGPSLAADDFNYADRCEFLAALSPLLEPTTTFPITAQVERAAGGRSKLDAWLEGLRDFDKAAHVRKRLPELSHSLEADLKPLRAAIENGGFIAKIERYTGLPFGGRYEVLATPFLDDEKMRNSVLRRHDGSYELRTIMGLGDKRAHRDYFFKERIPATIMHQIEHGVLDALAETHSDEIQRSEGAYKKLPWSCFGSWKQCVKENMVRAVLIRVLALEVGPEAAARLEQDEPSSNFPYTRALVERLGEYERDRKRYPSLALFYGRLLEVFARSRP